MATAELISLTPTVLLLEDSPLDAELVAEQLRTMQPEPQIIRAARRADFVDAVSQGGFDIILADFSLPDFDGMSALDIASKACPDVPFIFVSGVLGEEAAIESFRRGATDYILKQRLIRLPAAVSRALAEARERRDRRHAEEQREILVRELSHRVKNTMAMVMSIVRRTARGRLSVDDYADSLLQRLDAMAQAHALLFQSNWEEARLADIVERVVAAHDRNARFDLGGSQDVTLGPKSALAVSMVLNELVTNASKHGALSNDAGQVRLKWRQHTDHAGVDMVDIEWRESNGPIVVPPEAAGFGTALIERSVQYELEGAVDLHYLADGLTCSISFPL